MKRPELRILAVPSPEFPDQLTAKHTLEKLRETGWSQAVLEHGPSRAGRELARLWGQAGGRTSLVTVSPVAVLRTMPGPDLLVVFADDHSPLPREASRVAGEVGWPPVVTVAARGVALPLPADERPASPEQRKAARNATAPRAATSRIRAGKAS